MYCIENAILVLLFVTAEIENMDTNRQILKHDYKSYVTII